MTKMMRMLGCVVLLAAFVPACGDDGGGGSSTDVDSSMSQMNRARYNVIVQICECYADEQYNGDVDTCVEAERGDDVEFSSECKRDVAECYATEFNEYANCFSAALSDHEECLSSCPETERHLDYCISEVEDAQNLCGQALPVGLSEGMQACEDGERFVCQK